MELQEPAVAYHKQLSVEAYERIEQDTDCRHEYWYGEVFAMAGALLAHNEITYNIIHQLKQKRLDEGCRSFQDGAKLQLQDGAVYLYPDAMMTCNPDDLVAEKFVRNPCVLVEVLSPSTELHDRTTKWRQYRRLKTLLYYILVSQETVNVEVYSRSHEHQLFQYQAFENLSDVIDFGPLGFSISLSQIYDGVLLPKGAQRDPTVTITENG
jgi:Uma2 family endonuclease